jgi:hypothetical protein
MTMHVDQLPGLFEAHEDEAPDPAAVYARVQELARTYARRRRAYQAAGGAVVVAGVIAGILTLPGGSAQAPPQQTAASVPAATTEQALAAFDRAGYRYPDAEQLARVWQMSGPLTDVKAEAGRRLLAGQTLPLPVSAAPVRTPGRTAILENKRVATFFQAGYDAADAARLAELWNLPNPFAAKVEGGKRLLAGETLPIRP